MCRLQSQIKNYKNIDLQAGRRGIQYLKWDFVVYGIR